jgi:microcystin-dependent protein
MATITGFTAGRMLEIEDGTIVDAEVVGGELILIKHDGTQVNAGSVIGPVGPVGPSGPAGGLIPGEVRLWPNNALPELASYGLWTWANGGVFAVVDHPIAASHIATQWRTFDGASDPGAGNFRVPDLRGLVPSGMDQMPAGARANRMTRSVSIIIAGKSGKETHVISLPEMAAHNHGVSDPGHTHYINREVHSFTLGAVAYAHLESGGGAPEAYYTSGQYTGISIQNAGGNAAHENVQPTVFVPYIVKLDD